MVREVGFEPTNPYGTGASGLRVQDPSSTGLFDLAWQHEPPHRQGGLPRAPGHAPARATVQDKSLIGFRHPGPRQIRAMFN